MKRRRRPHRGRTLDTGVLARVDVETCDDLRRYQPPIGVSQHSVLYSAGRRANPVPFALIDSSGAPTLTIPFAALAALLAALLETSVAPEIPIAGATADLVLICAVAAALVLGVTDGLVAAFVGGLLVDLLVPGRPLGAATFSLLLITGMAAASGSFVGSSRRMATAGLAFVLTIAYEIVLTLVLVLTENAPLTLSPESLFVAGLISAVLVLPVGAAFALLERRFGAVERTPW